MGVSGLVACKLGRQGNHRVHKEGTKNTKKLGHLQLHDLRAFFVPFVVKPHTKNTLTISYSKSGYRRYPFRIRYLSNHRAHKVGTKNTKELGHLQLRDLRAFFVPFVVKPRTKKHPHNKLFKIRIQEIPLSYSRIK